jgi:hypothetical protein
MKKTKSTKTKAATPVRSERKRFEDFLKGFTFKWECVFDRQGRVIAEEDPDDPGGVTKYGIDKSGHPNLSATQIRNLTEDQAVEIYFTGEWPASHAGQLPVPLGEISFDMTVLDGTRDARLAECVWFDRYRNRRGVGPDHTPRGEGYCERARAFNARGRSHA